MAASLIAAQRETARAAEPSAMKTTFARRARRNGESMTAPARRGDLVVLQAGETLHEAGVFPTQTWRVVKGALRLDLALPEAPRFIQLALAGDQLGLESLCGLPTLYRARAVTRCVLETANARCDADRVGILGAAWVRLWCSATDLAALRTGPVAERVRQLLLLLALEAEPGADGLTRIELPSLADIGAIVDTAPETASRILSALRRQSLLRRTVAGEADFDGARLAAAALGPGLSRGARPADRTPR